MGIVEITRLSFRYPSGARALSDVSLNVAAGEFLVICGRSGSGKTTLLRHLKPQLSPRGEREGEILFRGEPLSSLGERESAAKIGFVAQSPEGQLVTDKVWHELAFGLESLGVPTAEIRRRVAEISSFFGLHNLFRADTMSLSGGQKQLLNLAAAMVTRPELLILDEPTSRLDPIAAAEFLAMLKKINNELGTTIILTEHRLEEALPLASRVVVMENGAVACEGSAAEVGKLLWESNSEMFRAMPAAARIWGELGAPEACPVSVNEGRAFLREFIAEGGAAQSAQVSDGSGSGDFARGGETGAENFPQNAAPLAESGTANSSKTKNKVEAAAPIAIELHGVWFKYERGAEDVLRGCDFMARFGEIVCVVGGNGAGKSTLLRLLAGAKKPTRGVVKRNGRACLLPQEPRLLFSKKTLGEELSDAPLSESRRVSEIAERCGISELSERRPYELSGGETGRAALAKLLLAEPEILLLDEPTSGLDAGAKLKLRDLLKSLAADGVCVIVVSHDIEFCAELGSRIALFFDGAIASEGTPREFFSDNNFYTTAARRVSRGFFGGEAITVEDVVEGIRGSMRGSSRDSARPTAESEAPRSSLGDSARQTAESEAASSSLENSALPAADYEEISDNKKIPIWRGICAAALVALTVAAWAIWGRKLSFSGLIGAAGVTAAGWRVFALFGLGIFSMGVAALLIRGGKSLGEIRENKRTRKGTLKSALIALVLIVLVAATVWLGRTISPSYYLTATAIIIECLAAFFIAEESRGNFSKSARRLAVIAALCALGVAGRAAFFWLPQVKPVLAIAILAGAGLGGEAGFAVGAVTMLVSNIMFGQGPWTPWQMFAAGTCGLLGSLARSGYIGFLRRRVALSIFGAVIAVVVYGGIVNPSSAFIWGGEALSLNIIATYWLTGLPMDALHGLATAAFLFVLSEPTLEAFKRLDC